MHLLSRSAHSAALRAGGRGSRAIRRMIAFSSEAMEQTEDFRQQKAVRAGNGWVLAKADCLVRTVASCAWSWGWASIWGPSVVTQPGFDGVVDRLFIMRVQTRIPLCCCFFIYIMKLDGRLCVAC